MKRVAVSILFLFSFPNIVTAQKSVSELAPSHASALQEFLTRHPDLDFMSEKAIDQDYLKSMRQFLGARLMPYYHKGDFNGDGRQDFALILAREGPLEDQGTGIAGTHRYRYPITIVVFNGVKGGRYRAAFVKNYSAPLVCFLNTTGGRKKRLYFGVFETDEAFGMMPVGRGYIVEYEY